MGIIIFMVLTWFLQAIIITTSKQLYHLLLLLPLQPPKASALLLLAKPAFLLSAPNPPERKGIKTETVVPAASLAVW